MKKEALRGLWQRLLPRKNRFLGIDVGAHEVKAAEVRIIEGAPEVVALRRVPSPPGAWTEQVDEDALVEALKQVAGPHLKEAITCIGGEQVVARTVRLPRMSEKEMEAAARFEVEKFVPTPVDQLIVRYVPLERPVSEEALSTPRAAAARAREAQGPPGGQEEGQSVLLLAVPAATVFRYHSIFSRAGLVVTAVDHHAFALWRLFGRATAGTLALADVGAETSHLVVVRDEEIKFVRLLPIGGSALTRRLMDAYGVELAEAEEMKREAAVGVDGDQGSPGAIGAGDFLIAGLSEIAREIRRSLEFCASQDGLTVERLVLSGGSSKQRGLAEFLQADLGVTVEVGVPQLEFGPGVVFDPAFAVAVGLALREVAS